MTCFFAATNFITLSQESWKILVFSRPKSCGCGGFGAQLACLKMEDTPQIAISTISIGAQRDESILISGWNGAIVVFYINFQTNPQVDILFGWGMQDANFG